MLKIKQLVAGSLYTNCYLVFDSEEKRTLIIDPGDDADYISRNIESLDLIPEMVVATHGHYDHIMAAGELCLNYQIPFRINKKDEFLVERLLTTVHRYEKRNDVLPPKIESFLKEGDKLSLGQHELAIIETPGHTPGSISLVSDSFVLVGDLIFADGYVGRTDFSYSRASDLKKSIRKVLGLPSKTLVYPGHGEEFYLHQVGK